MYYSTQSQFRPVVVFMGDEEVTLPTRWEICDRCDGHGKHSLRFGAFRGQRLEEAQADEEFWQDYMSGTFDERCETCEGSGKVRAVDEDNLTPEQKKAYQEHLEDEAEQEAERRAEYRMSPEYLAELRGWG